MFDIQTYKDLRDNFDGRPSQDVFGRDIFDKTCALSFGGRMRDTHVGSCAQPVGMWGCWKFNLIQGGR